MTLIKDFISFTFQSYFKLGDLEFDIEGGIRALISKSQLDLKGRNPVDFEYDCSKTRIRPFLNKYIRGIRVALIRIFGF